MADSIPTGKGNEVRYNCPFCKENTGREDTKYHLYFDPDRLYRGVIGQFVCYRCGERGSWRRLRTALDISESSRNGIDSRLTRFRWGEVKNDEDSGKSTIIDPPGIPITKGSPAEDYLIKRGFSTGHIKMYKLLEGVGSMSGRVIIPAYKEDKIVFWQARSVKDSIKPKYISPPSSSKGDTIFNIESASESKRMHIKEGPLNAIMGGLDCVALFGKEISPGQLSSLIKSGVKEFVICLDDDAFKWSLRLAQKIKNKDSNLKVFVYIPPMGKDTVDVGFREFRRLVKDRTVDVNTLCGEETARMTFQELMRKDMMDEKAELTQG